MSCKNNEPTFIPSGVMSPLDPIIKQEIHGDQVWGLRQSGHWEFLRYRCILKRLE